MNLDELKQPNKPPFVPGQRPSPPQGPPRVPPPTAVNPIPFGGLPAGYLAKGYFDEKDNIFPELIIKWSQEIAGKLADNSMNSAQLRKFFGEFRHIEDQLKAGKDFDSLRARINKIDGKVTYALTRRTAPLLFEQFIKANLQYATRDKKHLLGFIDHFECIVAYFPKK